MSSNTSLEQCKICPVCGYEWGMTARYCGSPTCTKEWQKKGFQGTTPALILGVRQ